MRLALFPRPHKLSLPTWTLHCPEDKTALSRIRLAELVAFVARAWDGPVGLEFVVACSGEAAEGVVGAGPWYQRLSRGIGMLDHRPV